MRAHVYCAVFASLIVAPCTANAIEPPQLSVNLMYDSNNYRGSLFEDEESTATRTSYLRRLKLSAKMNLMEDLTAKVALDFDNDEQKFEVDDAYLEFRIAKPLRVYLGRFKEPFGLENQQSLKTQYLMERSAPTNLLTFGRNHGVSLHYQSDLWTVQTAVMKVPSEDNDFDDAFAYVGRLTIAPIQEKRSFVHVGVGASKRNTTASKYQLEDNLIAYGTGDLINSAKHDAEEIHAGNIEFAAQYRFLLLQTEYLRQNIQTEEQQGVRVDGSYATLAWTLMGKPREYDDGEIKLSSKAKHTIEIAYRHSAINLTGGIKGDMATAQEIAVNYYTKEALKLTLQYERGRREDWDEDGQLEVDHGQSLNVRVQFLWE